MKSREKKIIKRRAKRLGFEILEALKELGDLMPSPLEGKYSHMRRLRNYNKHQVYTGLWRLSHRGLVKKVRRNKKIYYQITSIGNAWVVRRFFRNRNKQRRADQLSTIVLFDIPENRRKHRAFLRKVLIQSGFSMLQRSVFIGPWSLPEDFEVLLKELKIDSNVRIIEGRLVN